MFTLRTQSMPIGDTLSNGQQSSRTGSFHSSVKTIASEPLIDTIKPYDAKQLNATQQLPVDTHRVVYQVQFLYGFAMLLTFNVILSSLDFFQLQVSFVFDQKLVPHLKGSI